MRFDSRTVLVTGAAHGFGRAIAPAHTMNDGDTIFALATGGAKRSIAYPEIPTVAESGLPGFEWSNSYALFAPAAVSTEIMRSSSLISAAVPQALCPRPTTATRLPRKRSMPMASTRANRVDRLTV